MPKVVVTGQRSDRPYRPNRSFLVWWVLLMSFWIWIDDSLDPPELVVGAAVSLVAAFLADLTQYQASTRIHIRARWLTRGWKIPGEVVRDMGIIFAALWRTVRTGQQPESGFREIATNPGDDTPEGDTWRTLRISAASIAPNTLALGLDRDRGVMVVHHLVVPPHQKEG